MLVGITLTGNSIRFIIAFSPNIFTQLFIVHFMTINPFFFVHGLCQFHLNQTMIFNSFMSKFNSIEHFFLRNLIHLTLNHHDILVGRCNHDIQVSSCQLALCRVNHQLPVHTSYTYLRNRTVERNITHSDSCRGSQSGQTIRHRLFITRVQRYLHESFSMIIIREQRSQSTVDQTGYQNLVIGSSSLSTGETSGETSYC